MTSFFIGPNSIFSIAYGLYALLYTISYIEILCILYYILYYILNTCSFYFDQHTNHPHFIICSIFYTKIKTRSNWRVQKRSSWCCGEVEFADRSLLHNSMFKICLPSILLDRQGQQAYQCVPEQKKDNTHAESQRWRV